MRWLSSMIKLIVMATITTPTGGIDFNQPEPPAYVDFAYLDSQDSGDGVAARPVVLSAAFTPMIAAAAAPIGAATATRTAAGTSRPSGSDVLIARVKHSAGSAPR